MHSLRHALDPLAGFPLTTVTTVALHARGVGLRAPMGPGHACSSRLCMLDALPSPHTTTPSARRLMARQEGLSSAWAAMSSALGRGRR